ncbi:MAG: hypothetical protein PVG39_15095, partial [Desulfobacteraceae bacterium]
TAAMDMLHAPESMLTVNTDIWKDIVKNREKFYTKNLSSFINYARHQASKYGIKGSRLNAVSQVISIFEKSDENLKLKDIWDMLPMNKYCHDVGLNPNGVRQYQVCGKTFQETVTIGYVLPILRNFYDEYGHRAKLAAENKNIDWKAISHALRAAIQTKEILVNGTITFPLKDASFLLSVKSGELDYSKDVAPVLESLMEEVEELIKQSNLPEKVDIDFWNNFICATLEKARFK